MTSEKKPSHEIETLIADMIASTLEGKLAPTELDSVRHEARTRELLHQLTSLHPSFGVDDVVVLLLNSIVGNVAEEARRHGKDPRREIRGTSLRFSESDAAA
ncbi:hypothetical protein AB1K56_02755 [Microbacterium sp. BWR-S6Y]|uniref:hypothetical protein n=1 Tax=Microbacterium sp. BWR-S6Y TaxID=3232073 RepID=UPI0035285E88